MSLVIAIKDGDRIVFGADKQATSGDNRTHLATKIWTVRDCPSIIMGGVGSVRATQIMQYSSIINKNFLEPTGLTTEFIVNQVCPRIVEVLRTSGINVNANKDVPSEICISSAFLIAENDKAWLIHHDLSVIEIDKYYAIGSGSQIANGALFVTPNQNPFTRITDAIDAAAENTLFVDHKIEFLTTKVKEDDEKKIVAALYGNAVADELANVIETTETDKNVADANVDNAKNNQVNKKKQAGTTNKTNPTVKKSNKKKLEKEKDAK